jgi:imidazoleglycerol-phosphate dehydratase/histidinol-phosphatase
VTNRCLFIERIGGLLERPAGPITALEALRLQAGCIAAMRQFRAAGYQLIVLDDPRADSATGDAPRSPFIASLFASQGVEFDAVHACTHPASANCDCAVPGIGLVADYIADTDLDRARSVVVGDREDVLKLARNMGLAGYRLDTEHGWPDLTHQILNRPRQAHVTRKTRETDISVSVDLDRSATPSISTGIGFFDHMLEQLGKHGGFALRVACRGDLEVDEHHTVEDVALAIGQARMRGGFYLPLFFQFDRHGRLL